MDGVDVRSLWNGTGKKSVKIQRMRGATKTPTRGLSNSAGVVDAWLELLLGCSARPWFLSCSFQARQASAELLAAIAGEDEEEEDERVAG